MKKGKRLFKKNNVVYAKIFQGDILSKNSFSTFDLPIKIPTKKNASKRPNLPNSPSNTWLR